MALAFPEEHPSENASDQSVPLVQKYLGLNLTGQNQSDRCGLPSAAAAAAAGLVAVTAVGFAEAGRPPSADCVVDL